MYIYPVKWRLMNAFPSSDAGRLNSHRRKSSGHQAATRWERRVALKSISKRSTGSTWPHLFFLLLGVAVQPFSTSPRNCHQLWQPRQAASIQWVLNTCLPNELCSLSCSKGCCVDCSIFKKQGGGAAYKRRPNTWRHLCLPLGPRFKVLAANNTAI